MEAILFYIFAALTLGGGVFMITRHNVVLSAVWLTVSLLGVAGLFLLLGAEFLFVAQIVLYIGGVTLLFLFVIMLVNLDTSAHLQRFRKMWPVAVVASSVFASELIALLCRSRVAWHVTPESAASRGNTEAIADLLLSRYMLPFEIASVLLLVAIVGSVWMGHQRRREQEKVEV